MHIASISNHRTCPFIQNTNVPKIVFVSLYSFVASVRINEPKLKSAIFFSYLYSHIVSRRAAAAGKGVRSFFFFCNSIVEKGAAAGAGVGEKTHAVINARQRSFPSLLFIHSSSSVTSLACGASANSGNSRRVCSKISSSYLQSNPQYPPSLYR